METNIVDFAERKRVAGGIRTAALIVVLGAVALMADHAYFVAPHARAVVEAPAPAPTSVMTDGFVVPEHLRPTAADVSSEPSTF